MASIARSDRGRILLQGTICGITGGILIDVFYYVASLLPEHASILTLWQFVASTALGKVASTSTSYAWIGLLMHAAVSIAWGTGYVYLANTQSAINRRPVLSGVVFGVVVYVAMQLVLYSVQALRITSYMDVVAGLVAHCVFFGIPVAIAAAAQMRTIGAK